MQVQEDLLEVSWGSGVLALEPCRTVLAGKNEVCTGAQSCHVWQRSLCSAPQPSARQCHHTVALLRWLQTTRVLERLAWISVWQALPSCLTLGMKMHCATAASNACMTQHAAAGREVPLWCRSCSVGLGLSWECTLAGPPKSRELA